MMMNLRLEFFSGASLSAPLPLLGAAALVVSCCISACSGTLLSSEIILVIGLSDAESTRQRELGDVVLVERADVLVVGLLGLGLGLGDGQVVDRKSVVLG